MGRRERRQPERYIGYMALVSQLVYSKPSIYEEAAQ